jgi:hypothetical protein
LLSLGAESYGFQFAIQKYKIKIYRTIILPVVCGSEIWSLIMWEELRLRVFGKRVLRRIFGPKRDEVTGTWRRLHNEELNDLYSSPNITRVITSKRMRWAGNLALMGEWGGAFRVLVGSPKERGQLEDPGLNGRIILKWIFRNWDGGMDWIDLAQNRDR